jgi:uncharacterized GH25 family protein
MKKYFLKQRHYGFQLVLLLLMFNLNNANSHDFWLEAHPFYTKPLKAVDISIHVGNEFAGDSLPNIKNWYSDFSLYQPGSRTKIEGELGRDPAGFFTPDKNGTYAIGYQSSFTFIEIDPDTFLKYLTMEGLDHAIEYRQKNGLSETPGKESYIRHPKALVQSGDRFEIDNSMLTFGYELEIVPLSNPYRMHLNDTLSVKVLYQGKPIKDILLIALSKAHPEKTQSIRTDRDGIASIKLNQSGPWLLKAVHIFRVKDDQADWQSHWASLTFAMRD